MFETFRDITISLDGIKIDCQVPITDIVSFYFKDNLKKHLRSFA